MNLIPLKLVLIEDKKHRLPPTYLFTPVYHLQHEDRQLLDFNSGALIGVLLEWNFPHRALHHCTGNVCSTHHR